MMSEAGNEETGAVVVARLLSARMLAKLILTSVSRLMPNLSKRHTSMSRLQRTDWAVPKSERCLPPVPPAPAPPELDDEDEATPNKEAVALLPELLVWPLAVSNEESLNLSLKLADEPVPAPPDREPNKSEVSTPEKHERGLVWPLMLKRG